MEAYISECVESLKKQTFPHFECILVDDGSLDNSYQMARQAVGNDERFQIIRQKNTGQGGARNNGLAHAKGEFVSFIDADDWVEPSFLENLYHIALNENADIVVCGMNFAYPNGEKVLYRYNLQEGVYVGEEKIREILLGYPHPCDKLFRRNLFENVEFLVGVYYEDCGTLYKLAKKAKKLVKINQALYNYFQQINSTTRQNATKKNIDDRIFVYNDTNKNLGYTHYSTSVTSSILHMYVLHYANPLQKKELVKYVQQKLFVSFKEIFQEYQKNKKIKNLLMALFFKIVPNSFIVFVGNRFLKPAKGA